MQHCRLTSFLRPNSNNLPKRTPRSPDPFSQTRQLNDLGVVDKQIRIGPLVLDVIREYFRISCFEPVRVKE